MQIIGWDQGYAISCENDKSVERDGRRKDVTYMLAELLRSYLTNALRANAYQFIGNNGALMGKKLEGERVPPGSSRTF